MFLYAIVILAQIVIGKTALPAGDPPLEANCQEPTPHAWWNARHTDYTCKADPQPEKKIVKKKSASRKDVK